LMGGLAYLLARTSDTIADTQLLPLDQRLVSLHSFRKSLLGSAAGLLNLAELARNQGSPAERTLLENCGNSFRLLREFSHDDQQLISAVLQIIISGQELDLRRFAQASPEDILSLGVETELDDYTYRVAGCVGEFWTRMCRRHLFPRAELDDQFLLTNGVRFGKGLQLVNILRDLPADLRHGRCYLPSESLQTVGLKPQDLLRPDNESHLRPLYNRYLDRAEADLAAGWAYTNRLPRSSMRVRLACAWPLLIGRRTIVLLREGRILQPQNRLKVSRREVKGILWRSVVYYPWFKRWEQLFPTGRKQH